MSEPVRPPRRKSSRSHPPVVPRPLRYLVQCGFSASLVLVALRTEGWPSLGSIALGVLMVLGVALTSPVARPGEGRRRRVALAALTLLLAGLLLAFFVPRFGPWRGEAQGAWIFAAIVPAVVLLRPSTRFLGAELSTLPAVVLTASLALGLLARPPWSEEGPRLEWTVASFLGLCTWLLTRQDQFLARAASARILSRPVANERSSPRFAIGGSLWVLVLSSLFLSAGHALRSTGEDGTGALDPALFDPSSRDLEEFDDLGIEGLLATALDERVVAIARRVAPDDGPPLPLRRVYLRESVLERWSDPGSGPRLVPGPRSGISARDTDDGRIDGRIPFRHGEIGRRYSWPGNWPERETQVLEVIVQAEGRSPRWIEPPLAWCEGEELRSEAGDVLFDVLQPVKYYRAGSVPELYFAIGFEELDAEHDPEGCTLPDDLPDEEWLRRVFADRARGSNDLQRIRSLARSFQENGRWSLSPQWDGSYRRFLEGENASGRMVGVCAHFAQTAALLCRIGGFEARVAVGYCSDALSPEMGGIVFQGRDRHAWLEVRFAELGWVAFEVTPGRSDDLVGGPQDGGSGTEGDGADEAGTNSAWSRAMAKLDRHAPWWLALFGLALALLLGRGSRSLDESTVSAVHGTRRRAGVQRSRAAVTALERALAPIALRRAPAQTVAEFVATARSRLPSAGTALSTFLEDYHLRRWAGRSSSRIRRGPSPAIAAALREVHEAAEAEAERRRSESSTRRAGPVAPGS